MSKQPEWHLGLFVHLPKTAGTSFRYALEQQKKTLSDYGQLSPQTDSLLLDTVYEGDFCQAIEQIEKSDVEWLAGHFSLRKYLNFVDVRRVVSFVREPTEQVISHYYHSQKLNGFAGSFEEFIRTPKSINVQSRHLGGVPIGLIGYIGITELYGESLQLINRGLQLQLRNVTKNVSEARTDDLLLSDGIDREAIKKINQHDVAFYTEARWLHQQRLAFAKSDKPWTYGATRIIQAGREKGTIVGCCFSSTSEQAVSVDIYKDGKHEATLIANEFYQEYPKANFPRHRYIGFRFKSPTADFAESQYDVYVSDTKQKLNFEPLVVK
ncbi:hypothetical protein IC617_10270 [Neiella sp. HB171785]|uniref:Sulfotransferase family protein n=1 Tax=Neiella litorisoli TaxID=2771431 RepID=A0A8J6QUG7_9GAMM|nr:hypothetical protein [Neiella litorisoli]MBD1389812.1 hypothetical protein [Neiella litorisoli]